MTNAVATRTTEENGARPKPHEQLPAIAPPRLPYHPAIQERFGVDKASWKALVEAIFPNATSTASVILALSYCRARKLDPFKRNVHIVPIWNKDRRRYIDTIWPGIGELRTTAFRTGEYAGRGPTTFGDDVTRKVGKMELTFPEWAQVTVYRVVKGQRVEFAGPRVYWIETYANIKRDDDTPNDMWANRPRGQIDKCAEAAALRAAFPEEIGTEYIPEEVQYAATQTVEATAVEQTNTMDALADRLLGVDGEMKPEEEPAAETDAGERPQEGDTPNPDIANGIDLDLQAAEGIGDCEEIKSKWLKKCQTEADRTCVVGACDEKADEIRASRGAGSNKK